MSKSIGKSATWLTVTKFLNLAIGMVTVMLLSRFISLEEFGTYSQLLLVVTVMTAVLIMGLPGSINYFLAGAKNNDEQSNFLSNYYTVSTVLSIITGGSLVIMSPFIADYFSNPLITTFWYVLAFFPWVNIVGSSIDNVLIVYDRITLLSIYRITLGLASLATVIVAISLNLSFQQYFSIFMSIQVIFTLGVYVLVKKLVVSFRPCFDINLIKKIFAFAIPFGIATIVGTIHIETSKIMVGKFYDTETLAIFTNASREMPITIIVTSIIAVISPHIARHMQNNCYVKGIDLWKSATVLAYILLCFFAMLLFVFAPQILSLLYSDKYLPGVNIFRVFCVKLLIQSTYYSIVLLAIGKTQFVMYASILACIVNVVLNYMFFLFFGLNGFATATLLSTGFGALLQLYYSAKETNTTFKSIFPWQEIFKTTMLNIFIAIIVINIFNLLQQHISGYLAMGITSCAAFGVYLLYMKKRLIRYWTQLNSGGAI